MNKKALIRQQFRDAVFKRDNHQCVICTSRTIEAHHIMDRSLFPDGGYHIDNGASLCPLHHTQAECGALSCKVLRRAAKIKHIHLPLDYDPQKSYDKWGRIL